MVTAYGMGYKALWTKPLDQVKGMAWGVREDAEKGIRLGLVCNQCISEESKGVWNWEIVEVQHG